jgi:L-amino acid N-acyltransferase YncA
MQVPPQRKGTQMVLSDLAIVLATRDDVPGIVDLQERNLSEHGGQLSVRWPANWFEHAITEMPIIVARSGRWVVGYLVSAPQSAQAGVAIVQAMLAAYRSSIDAYIYGPVCVEEQHRNRGVAASMFERLRTQLPGREGLTFIRGDNIASRRVHGNLGMREVGKFEHGGVEYIVATYIG